MVERSGYIFFRFLYYMLKLTIFLLRHYRFEMDEYLPQHQARMTEEMAHFVTAVKAEVRIANAARERDAVVRDVDVDAATTASNAAASASRDAASASNAAESASQSAASASNAAASARDAAATSGMHSASASQSATSASNDAASARDAAATSGMHSASASQHATSASNAAESASQSAADASANAVATGIATLSNRWDELFYAVLRLVLGLHEINQQRISNVFPAIMQVVNERQRYPQFAQGLADLANNMMNERRQDDGLQERFPELLRPAPVVLPDSLANIIRIHANLDNNNRVNDDAVGANRDDNHAREQRSRRRAEQRDRDVNN
jgi:hypothetical protein